MPVSRRRLAALAAAGVLAAPASALGQSAGDDQYQDPFAQEEQGQSQGGGGSEAPAAPAPATASEPAAPAPAAQAPEPAAETGAPAQPQLPYTGGRAGAVLLAGSVLLAGGVVLRVRLRERS